MLSCGIVILAAGEARRFGSPKQLLSFEGSTLLRRCAQTAIASTCRPIFVVTGNKSDDMAKELSGLPVNIVLNPQWQSGIGSSIRAGVTAAKNWKEKLDAVCLLLCDQPLISSAAIEKLIQSFASSGKPICAASYTGTLGTPAVFKASLFDELINLTDTEGGKTVIRRHSADVHSFDLPEAAIDIDTQTDLANLKDRSQETSN
jgi:molybdenum cofactor cytidylyltransferase